MQRAISQTETRSNANVRMPIDVNGWRAGIANTKYCYFLHVKQQSNGTFSVYSISILWIFIYLYVFIISSLATGPLSVCATVMLNVFRFEKLSLSPWPNKNTLILSYSLCQFRIINGTHGSYNLFSFVCYKARSYFSDLSCFLYLHPCIKRDVWPEDNVH